MSDLPDSPPLILFEDEHLLVINKPAGWNTHAPAPFAGEGVYDWLRHREPRWAALAIIHRLDKETSGVLVFSKTTLGNRSLTRQFAERTVHKKYFLVTDHPVPRQQFSVKSAWVRVGEKYVSRPPHAGAEMAETRFRVLEPAPVGVPRLQAKPASPAGEPPELDKLTFVEAQPVTGRTHQIRAHAAASGFPIRGDLRYGGTPAARLCLHAAELRLRHPATGEQVRFAAPPFQYDSDPWFELRHAFISPRTTNAYRLVNGSSDGWPGWYVDRLGDYLLSQSARSLSSAQIDALRTMSDTLSLEAGYHKTLTRDLRKAKPEKAVAQLVIGRNAPDHFAVRENGVRFEVSFREGYSVGLFLDQRDNRRRLLAKHVAADFPLFESDGPGRTALNTFAYTCGFSVCVAKAGLRVTSLDLSKKFLDWGKRNFALNDLDPAGHDFIYGDTFDWLRRFANKRRLFDVVILDPPTFSQSKEHGAFQVERDYGRLVKAALTVLKTNGVLLACTNAMSIKPESFLAELTHAIGSAGRKIRRQHYVPQPPDFPITREEPGYLKTVWLRIG